uniref:SUN domain-containing protein n=1 Tax=Leptocylindrus danicus TaxID=163516 RepID=A0A7S2P4Q8_9STRA
MRLRSGRKKRRRSTSQEREARKRAATGVTLEDSSDDDDEAEELDSENEDEVMEEKEVPPPPTTTPVAVRTIVAPPKSEVKTPGRFLAPPPPQQQQQRIVLTTANNVSAPVQQQQKESSASIFRINKPAVSARSNGVPSYAGAMRLSSVSATTTNTTTTTAQVNATSTVAKEDGDEKQVKPVAEEQVQEEEEVVQAASNEHTPTDQVKTATDALKVHMDQFLKVVVQPQNLINIKAWSIVFLVLYLCTSWYSIPSGGTSVLSLYKSMLGMNPKSVTKPVANTIEPKIDEVIVHITKQKDPVYTGPTVEELMADKKKEMLATRLQLQQEMEAEDAIKLQEQFIAQIIEDYSLNSYGVEDGDEDPIDVIVSEMVEVAESLSPNIDALDGWSDMLGGLEDSLQQLILLDDSDEGDEEEFDEVSDAVVETIEDTQAISPLVIESMADLGDVEVLAEECDTEPMIEMLSLKSNDVDVVVDDSEILDREWFTQIKADMVEGATLSASMLENDELLDSVLNIMADEEVNDLIKDAGSMGGNVEAKQKVEPKGAKMRAEFLKSMEEEIDAEFEINRADQTGKKDYASIKAGASVIREGRYKTSKCIVDDLSVWNRFLAAAKLRFYGFPAEAALSPTYPRDSLGQCWAFTPDPFDERDVFGNFMGSMGTLIVKLSEPVKVGSMVIEHPPKDFTPHPETAIKDFRVIGFEDLELMRRWDLGSFTYDIENPQSLQEFFASSDGMSMRKLRVIVLAIDSNWGHDYSCLYRFRVHAKS